MSADKDIEQLLRSHYQTTETEPGSLDRLRGAIASIANNKARPTKHSRRLWLTPVLAAAAVVAAVTGGLVIANTIGRSSQHQGGAPTTSESSLAIPRRNLPLTPVPTTLPSAHLRGKLCVVNWNYPSANGSHLPVVSTQTVGAIITWLPPANFVPCKVTNSSISESVAKQLAQTINSSPPSPAGNVAGCSGGAAVRIYFRLPGTDRAELVTITIGGCSSVLADGFRSRAADSTVFRTIFEQTAPRGWRVFLRTGQ
jgi:hypothetical protein